MNDKSGHGSHITDLSPSECWELAATQPVGRIAWTGAEGPTVVPVNFVVEDRTVHVRTAAYSSLARECDDSPVAFEIDSFDPESHSGWSVLMRGRAHIDFGDERGTGPEVWPAGSRALHLRVVVDRVTGRAVEG
jgi:nitroimidazol reductase NimA-like FMN-containing flavoprotein (pyridoxamine 5'-phosphate oxidase superfamily)